MSRITQPTKSKKYNKHYASKKEFPTTRGHKGGVVGHKAAQRSIEQKLERKLHDGTKIRTAGGNWVFVEPLIAPSLPA